MRYISDNGEVMAALRREMSAFKGRIRPISRQRNCPKCGKPFTEIPKYGFFCRACETTPDRFMVDLWYDGERYRICSDLGGMAIDSYSRAVRILSRIQTDIDDKTFDPSRYVKSEASEFYCSTLLDRFLKHKERSVAPSYLKDYRRMVGLIRVFFGTKDIREIRKLHLVTFMEHLQDEHGYQGKSLKNIMDMVKTFLRWCHADIEAIPTVPPFPELETPRPSYRYIAAQDQPVIFECVTDEHKPIIGFLMLSGCRPSEARALKCRDVDLEKGIITIRATFSGRVYREQRKGRGARPAVIPIHPEMMDYISSRVKGNLPDAWLFFNKKGDHYSENSLRRVWDAVREKAGIDKDVRLYDATRHSLASNLVANGVSLPQIKDILGHTTIATTQKYAHPDLEALRAAVSPLSLKPQGPQGEGKKVINIRR